jgi:hypothetical protein
MTGDSLLVALLENPSHRLISLVDYDDMDTFSNRFNEKTFDVSTQRRDDSGNDKSIGNISSNDDKEHKNGDNISNYSNESGINSNRHFSDGGRSISPR